MTACIILSISPADSSEITRFGLPVTVGFSLPSADVTESMMWRGAFIPLFPTIEAICPSWTVVVDHPWPNIVV